MEDAKKAKEARQAKEDAKANWMLVEHCLFRVVGVNIPCAALPLSHLGSHCELTAPAPAPVLLQRAI